MRGRPVETASPFGYNVNDINSCVFADGRRTTVAAREAAKARGTILQRSTKMKNLAMMLVAVVAAPAYAVLVFNEPFDGIVGDNIDTTSNWASWDTQRMNISDELIDVGNSMVPAGSNWGNYNGTLLNVTIPNDPKCFFRYSWVNKPNASSAYYAAYAYPAGGGRLCFIAKWNPARGPKDT